VINLGRLDEKAGLPAYRPRQVEKAAPCLLDCASGSDVRGWIGVVSQRHRTGLTREDAFAEAWRILTDANPFPAILGRICPHPCESACTRSEKDSPVSINAMERFLGDWAIDKRLDLHRIGTEQHPETIGVIGAGPSGLSFAYQLARRGYRVTIYERNPKPGGMLRYGVPDYRLPPSVIDAEVGRIIDLGVEIRTGVTVGVDVDIDELRDAHDLLYLGIGAQMGRTLNVPGGDSPRVLTGIDYLGRINRGEECELGARVAVIGGGNTAIDAARVARRAGADVSIVYRRTKEEMPAVPSEIDEAIREGINIEFLAAPIEIIRQNGYIESMSLQRMVLGEPGADGRRRPVPVPGSRFSIQTDSVIAAVSQEPEREMLSRLGILERSPSASDSGEVAAGLWAGGDVLGPDIAGTAIRHGRLAASVVHARLRGLSLPELDRRRRITPREVTLDSLETSEPAIGAHRPVTEALAEPSREVVQTIDEAQFLEEVERCFSCGLCMGCEACWMYCTPGSFTKAAVPGPGRYFEMNLDRCEECGKCIEVCPCGYLEAVT
jgi:NADPH-dependent glutamate synthase beta subunit-like oxidoreductase/ferredoxin